VEIRLVSAELGEWFAAIARDAAFEPAKIHGMLTAMLICAQPLKVRIWSEK
jgi:uncharacterized protein YecA (UPF0149 family)